MMLWLVAGLFFLPVCLAQSISTTTIIIIGASVGGGLLLIIVVIVLCLLCWPLSNGDYEMTTTGSRVVKGRTVPYIVHRPVLVPLPPRRRMICRMRRVVRMVPIPGRRTRVCPPPLQVCPPPLQVCPPPAPRPYCVPPKGNEEQEGTMQFKEESGGTVRAYSTGRYIDPTMCETVECQLPSKEYCDYRTLAPSQAACLTPCHNPRTQVVDKCQCSSAFWGYNNHKPGCALNGY